MWERLGDAGFEHWRPNRRRAPAKESGKEVGSISREEQLETLIDRYQHLIFSICYKMTEDYFTAEDLAQDTFLAAYEKAASFGGGNEKAWICRIATNKCLDYLKYSGRRSVPTEGEYFSRKEDKAASPEERCLEEEVRRELREACEALKPPYDGVALDYYYYELSVQEIAEKRDKNPKTVQTQIYRARGMLRGKMNRFQERRAAHGTDGEYGQ